MTKVVFQVGVLAFCVSAVLFGTQDLPLFAIVARAFIVFIAVVFAQVILLMVATNMKHAAPQRTAAAQKHEEHEAAAEGPGSSSSQTPAAA
ncbi:MAG: hypothetical protein H6Q31_482 [Bacteroidetes bacterium]|jgi:hypothetical protein|nr:hypothetical protein [Bacteroidota bacterium]